MGALLDAALVRLLEGVNLMVFHSTRGRFLPYRFGGLPALALTVIGRRTPELCTVWVTYIPDGDTYVLLMDGHAAEQPVWVGDLFDSEPTDIVTVEIDHDRSFEVEVSRLDSEEQRAETLRRLLARLPLVERFEVRRHRLTPVFRLTEISPGRPNRLGSDG
ncbi:nitroreductase/quinone reductase family protein [Sphaerisporangium fuscum]|uniref:nitroreductase/quinone reductase family protein n=1 Tax=Sphaerisporangium fuscum TaxID=2835868 RepID=UPI001BDD32F0|nr:nitroreductase/quinone reductase family protein [Sphaerisporangium fuscum]